MIYLGIDWAEAHHDVCLLDDAGALLSKARVREGLASIRDLVGEHTSSPQTVVVGIETDRGLLVQCLVATGYQVYALNPFAVTRYRDRHTVSRAKSDPGDAKVLAELVRTDRQNHRALAGDSEARRSPQGARPHPPDATAQLVDVPSSGPDQLREFYPAALAALGTDLASRARRAGPAQQCAHARGGAADVPQPSAQCAASGGASARWKPERPSCSRRCVPRTSSRHHDWPRRTGSSVLAVVRVIGEFNEQITALEAELPEAFEDHPDAEILGSLSGRGVVLGVRVLAEFGDDRTRYHDARARRCYAGSAPITRASGTRLVVLARIVRNRRLAEAVYLWPAARSPGGPCLLPIPSDPWPQPPPGAQGAGEPPRRHPARLPRASLLLLGAVAWPSAGQVAA